MDYNAIISFLSSKGGIIAGLTALLSLLLLFINLYQKIRQSKLLSRADLDISPFDNSERISALSGYPVVTLENSNEPVFTGGIRARISLAHNQHSDDEITIYAVKVKVIDYLAGEHTDLQYEVDFDKLIGRQIAPIRVFDVQLNGKKLHKSTWINSDHSVQDANSDNLLDVVPPISLSLRKSDRGEQLDITITAIEFGLYTLQFIFHYYVAGKNLDRSTEPIRFYFFE